jgi:hypothetical protein
MKKRKRTNRADDYYEEEPMQIIGFVRQKPKPTPKQK